MKFSYEGIGAWSATFAAQDVTEGQVVKLSASDTASPCAKGNPFIGVVISQHNGICGVQMGGLAEVPYSGSAPAVGKVSLTADGKGGVCTGESGEKYLVVSVDTVRSTCVIRL